MDGSRFSRAMGCISTIRAASNMGLDMRRSRRGRSISRTVTSTDARLADPELVTLKDDQHFFPQNRAVFLYRLDAPPEAIKAVAKLEGKISEAKMMALNSEAEKTKSYAAAAASYFAGDAGAASEKPRARKNPLAALPRLDGAASDDWLPFRSSRRSSSAFRLGLLPAVAGF